MPSTHEDLSPREIGKRIRELREKHSLTLKDISEVTNVPIDILSSLEAGAWKRLGSKFLIKSFVKSYCEALREPFDDLLEDIDQVSVHQYEMKSFKPLLASDKKPIKSMGKSFFYFSVIFISIFMVVGGIYLYRYNIKKTETVIPPQETTSVEIPKKILSPGEKVDARHINMSNKNRTSPLKQTQNALQQPPSPLSIALFEQKFQNIQAPGYKKTPLSTHQGKTFQRTDKKKLVHRLVISAVEKTWVKIWVDTSKPVSRLLQPGDTMKFSVKKEAKMVIGNAGGIKLRWDNKEFPNLGKRGAVIKIHIPEDLKETSTHE